MSTHDTEGREYAKLSQLRVGDTVKPDGGFECMKLGTKRKVCQNKYGQLYVRCRMGTHILDGQLSDEDGDHLLGIYPA